jgi:hypothetical protein
MGRWRGVVRSTKSVTEGSLPCFGERQLQDAQSNFVRIGHHLVAGNTKDLQAKTFEIERSPFIAPGIVIAIMNFAIYFHDKLHLGAIKVDNVRTDRMLFAEVNAFGFAF